MRLDEGRFGQRPARNEIEAEEAVGPFGAGGALDSDPIQTEARAHSSTRFITFSGVNPKCSWSWA